MLLSSSVLIGAASARERCLAIDGDTLVCNHQRIRLTNVYAAELNQAGGTAAKRRLQALVAAGEVTIVPHGADRYGRTLAEVYVDGKRIEQADIGPRAGRGSTWGADRHAVHSRTVVPGKPRTYHRHGATAVRQPSRGNHEKSLLLRPALPVYHDHPHKREQILKHTSRRRPTSPCSSSGSPSS